MARHRTERFAIGALGSWGQWRQPRSRGKHKKPQVPCQIHVHEESQRGHYDFRHPLDYGSLLSNGKDREEAGRRSEERRVGKECRSRWWRYDEKRKRKEERLNKC